MASLSEELAKLANPTPVFKDPEDDIDDDTAAKIVEKDYDEDFDDDDNQFSQLRRQTVAGLADSDNRYAGTKVTRKALKKISNDDSDDEINQSAIDALEKSLRGGDESMDDEDEGDNEDEDDDDIDDDEDDNDDDDDDAIDDSDLQKFRSKLSTEKKELSFEDDGDYSKYADDDDDDDDDEEDDKKEKDTEESEIEDEEEEQEDGGIESFSRTNQSEEIQKGKAAQSQLGLWDNLLEERIKVQKVASVINQLPQPATWDLFVEQGGDNYMQAVTEAQSVLKKLLDDLLRVQTLLLLQNQETRHVVDGSDPKLDKGSKPGSDDEEITSESETESTPVVKKAPRQQTDTQGLKRKFKMSDYPDFLSKRHKGFATYRNETLHKWNDKTRLASGKIKGKSFSALEQSALKQIEQIMRDKDRLIRRTQLKRSGQRILGVEEKVEEENQRHAEDNQEAAVSASPGDDYDGEVFDDSDFYHQLLRELIERKTSELNDPVAISRQWLEIEKLRTKVKKKKVDTRASKGRKIRYDVHAKLVNFMAPIDNSTWSDEARDDLFKSLFGKTVKI